MITRQSCYDALFKLKESGIDVKSQLEVMSNKSGVPAEVVDYLRDKSPQFQFYRSIQKHQRALMKNILNYDRLSELDKIKVASSFITRVVISIEYGNLSEELLSEMSLDKVSLSLHKAISTRDFSKLDEVMKLHQTAVKLFYKGVSDSES